MSKVIGENSKLQKNDTLLMKATVLQKSTKISISDQRGKSQGEHKTQNFREPQTDGRIHFNSLKSGNRTIFYSLADHFIGSPKVRDFYTYITGQLFQC